MKFWSRGSDPKLYGENPDKSMGDGCNYCIRELTESSKSPASIAKSNKQWVGTCLYQEECKLLLINCGAVIRL